MNHLMRFDPFADLEHFFKHSPASATPSGRAVFGAMDVSETDEAYAVTLDVPGVKLEDLEITVMNDELAIKGTRQAEKVEGVTYHRRGRTVQSVNESLRFPTDVEVDAVDATVSEGVLTINLPKAAKARPRKIELKQNNG